jgi:dTDP-4-dehydrorhamnose 3,5-epimerase-like enzyme
MLSARNRRQLWTPPGFAQGFAETSGAARGLCKTIDYRLAAPIYFVVSRRGIP